MAADTKTRILEAARALFNAEGYAALSAVDVATALAISPGHLYYHFKGKAEIASALLSQHEAEISGLLDEAERAVSAAPAIETLWTQVHILVEEVFDCRFAYRDGALNPGLRPALARIRRAEIAATQRMLDKLADANRLTASAEIRAGLAQQIALGLSAQLAALDLDDPAEPARARIARAAAMIMLPTAGYAQQNPRRRTGAGGHKPGKTKRN
jgi:AcrR family transcriptional regulator